MNINKLQKELQNEVKELNRDEMNHEALERRHDWRKFHRKKEQKRLEKQSFGFSMLAQLIS